MLPTWFVVSSNLLLLIGIGLALIASSRAHRRLVSHLVTLQDRSDFLHSYAQQNHGEVRQLLENLQSLHEDISARLRLLDGHVSEVAGASTATLQRIDSQLSCVDDRTVKEQFNELTQHAVTHRQQIEQLKRNELQWLHDRLVEQNALQEASLKELQGAQGQLTLLTEGQQNSSVELGSRLNVLARTLEPSLRSIETLRERSITPLGRSPAGVPAAPRQRSVLFLNHCYYHHYYLAEALRRRGWDAVTVNTMYDPNGPDAIHFHGEDIDLFDRDYAKWKRNIELFYEQACRRFDLLHFAGDWNMSFFNWEHTNDSPPDILHWRALGKKIAYTTSGCLSGVAQSSFAAWSKTSGHAACDSCRWQNEPTVCSDEKNLRWKAKVEKYVDVIFADGAPALDMTALPRCIRDAATSPIDPTIWHPNLHIPEKYRIVREQGEYLVFHSFPNYKVRTNAVRNLKGTPAIMRAVDRLKDEGMKVRLIFVTEMSNLEIRYFQAQADVIVDQLNHGRYGSNAKEGMALGRPVICHLNRFEYNPSHVIQMVEELPLVSASEATVYDVLKALLLDPERREAMGAAGREFILKWHTPEACAERYERIYDLVMQDRLDEYHSDRQLLLGANSV